MNAAAGFTAVSLVAVVATGCSAPADSPRPVVSATSASPTNATRAAVLAAYTGMWDDYEKDLLTANWQNPTPVNHARGDALMTLENSLALDGHNGLIGKGPVVLHPTVKSLTPNDRPTTAEIIDCVDMSHALLYVAKTGALEDTTPGGRHPVNAKLVFEGGVWMVSALDSGQVNSC
jgi:hypothetical protein